MYVLLTSLETNGIKITPTEDDVAKIGLKVASGEIGYEDLLKWILYNE